MARKKELILDRDWYLIGFGGLALDILQADFMRRYGAGLPILYPEVLLPLVILFNSHGSIALLIMLYRYFRL